MCDNNATGGTCVPVTLTVTETFYTGTASSTAGVPGLGLNSVATDGIAPSIGSATLAAGTNINNSSSIALDTTVRVTATSTNTLFTTNTMSSSTRSSTTTSRPSPTSHYSPSSPPSPETHITKSAVAGSIIGGLAGLALLSLLLLCCCRHRKKLTLKLKRKSSTSSSLDEKAKDLKLRESALAEAEKRKSSALQFVGPTYGGGFVNDREMPSPSKIGRALGSPTGSGESGGNPGTRRRSQDAREQVGRWI